MLNWAMLVSVFDQLIDLVNSRGVEITLNKPAHYIPYTFDTLSQYFTLKWSRVVFLYQAFHAGDIPCPHPLWSHEHSCDWLERVG